MNLRIARAFWFAHFTRTWPFLLIGLLLGAGAGLLFYVIIDDAPEEIVDVTPYLVAMLCIAIPIQLLGMLYDSSGDDSFTCRWPSSTLLLPVSSFSIAFHRFTFNLTANVVTVVLLYGLAWARFGELSTPWWDWVLTCASLCALLQFVALATSFTGDWSIGFLMATAVLYFVAPRPGIDAHPIFGPILAVLLPLAPIVVSFVGLFIALQLIREGSGLDPRPKFGRRALRVSYEPKPFQSAWHAQLWLETHHYWRPIWRTFVVLSLLFFGTMIYASTESRRFDPQLLQLYFFYVLSGIFAFAGVFISLQNRRWQIGPMASFLYTRPITIPQLTSARIVAALRVWSVFAVAAMAGFWMLTIDIFGSWNEPFVDVLPVALSTVTLFWVALWTWNSLVLALLYGLAIPIAYAVNSNAVGHYTERIFPFFVFVLFLLIVVHALRLRLFTSKVQWLFPLAVLLLMALWIYVSMRAKYHPDFSQDTMRLSIVWVFAVIVAPVVTIPVAHHYCRHR